MFDSMFDFETALRTPSLNTSASAGAGAGVGTGGTPGSELMQTPSKGVPNLLKRLFSRTTTEVPVVPAIRFQEVVSAYERRKTIRDRLVLSGSIEFPAGSVGLRAISEAPFAFLTSKHFEYSDKQTELVIDHLPFLVRSLLVTQMQQLNISVSDEEVSSFLRKHSISPIPT
jgi:hypothetical protein